jgi:hypothetical protein
VADSINLADIAGIAGAEPPLRELGLLARDEIGELSIPVARALDGIGALASTIQFVATWANLRRSGERIVVTDSVYDTASVGRDQTDWRDATQLIALLADHVTHESDGDAGQVFSARGEPAAAGARLLSAHSNYRSKNSALTHSPSKDTGELLPDAKKVSRLIRPVRDLLPADLRDSWPGGTRVLTEARSQLEHDFSDLVYELIENSHVWGRSSWIAPGRPRELENGLQFFRTRYIDAPVGELIAKAGVDSPLETYLGRSLPNYLYGRGSFGIDYRVRLLEVTVFDSGEGLAYWMAADGRPLPTYLTFPDEVRYTAAALHRGHGARDTIFFLSGQGIPRALEATSRLGGYIQLRTGRMALYRDFARRPFAQSEDAQPAELISQKTPLSFFSDWGSGNTTRFQEFANTKGTAYTILIPVFEERRQTRAR